MQPDKKEVLQEVIQSGSEELIDISEDELQELDSALQELDVKDRNSIIYFGSAAQEKLEDISNRMIDGVQNKDIGAAGGALNSMVVAIRGFDTDELDPNTKLSWWQKLFGATTPLVKFLQRYEEVRDQIDLISNDLEAHKSTLMSDIVSLDKLYDANLEFFRSLEIYIKAGEQKLEELRDKIIPQYQDRAADQEMMDVQNLKEVQSFSDDLERRVHDLRLSRQVAMQALPSIRLIQENDKSLVNKISSTLVNTIPLWRNQLAQTVTIFRSADAASALKDASDLTNELLEKNAEGLRDANRTVREQMERGIFDIESIKKANKTLIATLDDSLRIADEGKQARSDALIELEKSERELKEALVATRSKIKVDQPKEIEA